MAEAPVRPPMLMEVAIQNQKKVDFVHVRREAGSGFTSSLM